jgi:ribosome-binding factor A
MPREFSRTDRVADEIKRLLATLIQQEVSDPRVGMVNINDVDLTKDLAFAKIFVTFIGRDSDSECEKAASALNNAAGYLRSLLAKSMNLRTTPKLQFFFDKTPIRGQALSNLIDKALAEDERHPKDD